MDKLEQIEHLIAQLQALAAVNVTNIHLAGETPFAAVFLHDYTFENGKLVRRETK